MVVLGAFVARRRDGQQIRSPAQRRETCCRAKPLTLAGLSTQSTCFFCVGSQESERRRWTEPYTRRCDLINS